LHIVVRRISLNEITKNKPDSHNSDIFEEIKKFRVANAARCAIFTTGCIKGTAGTAGDCRPRVFAFCEKRRPAVGLMLIGYTVLSRGGSVPSDVRGDSRSSGRDNAQPAEVAMLEALGCEKVFTDYETRRGERPNFRIALDFLRPGDVLVVPATRHLGVDIEMIVLQVEWLRRAGVSVRIGELFVPETPNGDAFSAICREFARLVEPPSESEPTTPAPTRQRGRPQALSAKDLAKARRLLAESTITISDVARALGVSPTTVYRYFPRRAPKPILPRDVPG
jgi:DNA invertase Pin-like site-specific DNA recombinase